VLYSINLKDEEIFGKIIKELRTSRSISQEKLSEITGLDRTFISLIETGKRNPTLTTIVKIANGLNIKPSELLSEFEKRICDISQNGDEDAH